jgi:hypothetical protein
LAARGVPEIRVDAEEGERRNDQHEEGDHDPFLVLGDEIEHVLKWRALYK